MTIAARMMITRAAMPLGHATVNPRIGLQPFCEVVCHPVRDLRRAWFPLSNQPSLHRIGNFQNYLSDFLTHSDALLSSFCAFDFRADQTTTDASGPGYPDLYLTSIAK